MAPEVGSGMPPERRCSATRDDGEPCRAPSQFVDPRTGLCWTHSEEGRELVREAARRGGQATARRNGGGLHEDELPELHTPQDAARFLEAVVRAVTTGRLGHHEAKAAVRGVREWLRAHEAGEVTDRLDDLMDALAQWRETGDPAPVLELVEGGGS